MDGPRLSGWQQCEDAPDLVGCRRRWVIIRSLIVGLCAIWLVQNLSCDGAEPPRRVPGFVASRKHDSSERSLRPKRTTDRQSERESIRLVNSKREDHDDNEEMIEPKRLIAKEDTDSLQRFPVRNEVPVTSMDVAIESEIVPIDLPAALLLAGVQSPQVLIAQQRVTEMTARQQLAAAQALPNLNLGTNYDAHTGVLQRASGAILSLQREALYVGAGMNAVAAGTVNMPGLQYNLNVGEAYFNYLVSRQLAEASWAASQAQHNNTFLQLTTAYCRLVQAQGIRAIRVRIRDDAAEIARITASYAKVGQGRPADADRAATELGRRNADILVADAEIAEASAHVAEILNLESSVQLRSSENWAVPRSIAPDLIPLPELIAIALYQRPELAERRAQVHAAMLELQGAQLLLFSPQFIAGFSSGVFGGGSNLNTERTGAPRFGSFDSRIDGDVVFYWSIRNLGLTNRAMIKMATAKLAATDFEQTQKLNEIRAEVADAYARTQARAAQLDIRQKGVAASERSYAADLTRARAGEGRPIEVLDSLRLLARAQQEYLSTIAEYNQAHYELYVAIGQPPADLLIHPVEGEEDIPPKPSEEKE